MRSNAINEVIASISKIPNPIQREVYLRECSRLTEMNMDIMRITLKESIKEDAEFNPVIIESFQEQSLMSKSFLYEQCEKRILQYVLAYGNRELNFKEIELVQENFGGQMVYNENIVSVKRTVIEKVVHELDNDGIVFTNLVFLEILNKAKTIDLNAFYLLKDCLDAETYLLAYNLRNEELTMNINSFLKKEIIGSEIVENELSMALEKSINESLLFYKTIFIEKLIEEESKKETVDMELISELVNLMVKIKRELNLI
jgi:DNA primase